jgi:hypothetical protein
LHLQSLLHHQLELHVLLQIEPLLRRLLFRHDCVNRLFVFTTLTSICLLFHLFTVVFHPVLGSLVHYLSFISKMLALQRLSLRLRPASLQQPLPHVSQVLRKLQLVLPNRVQ